MKITYIKLVGFMRFALRQSEVFEHYFNSKLTMITGPNGAGKSSLFNELTPLPADKSNYHKGGGKVIHITKDGKSYVLTSCFKEGTKYSFVCDDKELNLSGNVTTQRDLAQMHFSITPMIHELMTGAECFTGMTTVTRKKLFNAITNMNIDGILQSYDKLKEELKNNEFLAKTLTTRLVTEQHKLIDDNRKVELNKRLQGFKDHMDQLFKTLTHLHQYRQASSVEEVSINYTRACQELNAHYKRHLVALSAYPSEQCDTLLASHQTQATNVAKRLQTLYTQMEQLLHEKTSIELSKQSNKQDILKQVTYLRSVGDKLISDLKLIDPYTPHLSAVSAELNMLERSLPDILESMPINIDRKLSKSGYNDLLEESHTLTSLMHKSVAQRVQLSNELLELKQHKDLQCPSCSHSWLPSDVSKLIETTNQKLYDLAVETNKVQERLKAIKTPLEVQASYQQQVYEVNSLYSATKGTLSSFWKVVQDKQLLYVNPTEIASLVSSGIHEVMDIEKHREVMSQVTALETQLTHLEIAGNSSITENTTAIHKLESCIADTMDDLQGIKGTISDITQAKKYHTELAKLKQRATTLNKDLKAANLRHAVEGLITEINTELSLSKVSVMELQNELSQHDTIDQIVKDIQKQIQDTKENIKVLTLLTDELSPKNGFIAKSISHFLNTIIASINSIIASVWDYKMVLKAIDVDNDSLNYKFKVEVEDRLTVDDVSKASAGMKEMINLAMKITLFKLLKLDNHGVFLDEMASHLDSAHTEKIVNLIYKLTTSELYSQIFLITHKEDFSFLKNTETIAL